MGIADFRSRSYGLQHILYVVFCVAITVGFSLREAVAKDFGVVGRTWEIKEKDAVEEIKQKLLLMEKTGALEEHNEIIRENVSRSIKNPVSLGVPAAQDERTFTYDPSIVVAEDLRDARGFIFHKAGTKVNPLDTVSLPYKLIFFDAEDEKQLEYALSQHSAQEIKPKLILTGGSPIEIEEAHGLDAYFDQNGALVKQLGIKAVPAVVEQADKLLLIKEVKLEGIK